ncbi:Hypothetical predicted protein [Xyrichtys novacula]|uniref:Uncharacterized protein n=1 Tax=Xyrichtys novacula TaxID=13765 RepID=A0AAV1HHZ5_XYRNO|nr:Hypothetical predicted protein [Xyrichtys novacula]
MSNKIRTPLSPPAQPAAHVQAPGELPLWISDAEATWMLSLGLRRQLSQPLADCRLQTGNMLSNQNIRSQPST